MLRAQVNLAIGGRLPGVAPGPNTPFPQTLAIDYVRVYTCAQREWPAPLSSVRTAM